MKEYGEMIGKAGGGYDRPPEIGRGVIDGMASRKKRSLFLTSLKAIIIFRG